jgi:hypothetical protein
MLNSRFSYFLRNPVLQWLYKHGWEEPIGPLGPLHGAQKITAPPQCRGGSTPIPSRGGLPCPN